MLLLKSRQVLFIVFSLSCLGFDHISVFIIINACILFDQFNKFKKVCFTWGFYCKKIIIMMITTLLLLVMMMLPNTKMLHSVVNYYLSVRLKVVGNILLNCCMLIKFKIVHVYSSHFKNLVILMGSMLIHDQI